jgi:hypothetical protein
MSGCASGSLVSAALDIVIGGIQLPKRGSSGSYRDLSLATMYSSANAIEPSNASIQIGGRGPISMVAMTATRTARPKIHFALLLVVNSCSLTACLPPRITLLMDLAYHLRNWLSAHKQPQREGTVVFRDASRPHQACQCRRPSSALILAALRKALCRQRAQKGRFDTLTH